MTPTTDMLTLPGMEDLGAPPPTKRDDVLGFDRWASNGHLVEHVAQVHLAGRTGLLVVDMTYGLGKFWTRWRPEGLICHDRNPLKGDGVDARDTPHETGSVDLAVLDMPYSPTGGPSGGKDEETQESMKDFHDRYGREAGTTPEEIQQGINDGATEAWRILAPGGQLWLKCMDYCWSNSYCPAVHWTMTHCLGLGFTIRDRFEHGHHPGPQPGGRAQLHARRNHSTLLILESPTT